MNMPPALAAPLAHSGQEHVLACWAGLDDEARPLVAQFLNARAYTIFGGSSEIQREIVAREVLG